MSLLKSLFGRTSNHWASAFVGEAPKVSVNAVFDSLSDSYWLCPVVEMPKMTMGEFASSNKHFIFLMDISPSMRGGRMEAQRALMTQWYNDLPEGTEVSLIAMGHVAKFLLLNQKKKNAASAFQHIMMTITIELGKDFVGAFKLAKEAIEKSSLPSSATTLDRKSVV